MSVLDTVKTDIASFVARRKLIFGNERHLQVELAMALNSTGHYDRVHLEYRVPVTLLKHKLSEAVGDADNGGNEGVADTFNTAFPWSNSSNYFLDIVVEKDGEFIPVELKYATRSIDHDYTLFNQAFVDIPASVKKKVVLLNEQAAFDLIMYNYWKDVRRIEVMTRVFDNVPGGIALIVANNPAFWQEPRQGSGYRLFSTHQDNRIGASTLRWGDTIGEHIRNTHPEFELEGGYTCRWNPTAIVSTRRGQKEEFRYFITAVGRGAIGDYAVGDDESESKTDCNSGDDNPNINNTDNNNIQNKVHTNHQKTSMAIKSAISGEYIITQEDNGSIRVCQIFDNVIASLKEAAKSVGFKLEPNWKTTQGIGKKMVDALGDGYTAEAGEYTIVRRDNGHIDTYRVHGNTIAVLRKIASDVGLTPDASWNTRRLGSVLIDFINGDYTPGATDEVEEEMFEIRPDMTILELFDNFKAQFGGHLRIKDGVKRCDPHWNHQTTAVWVPVTEGTLAEIGCKAPGKFSVDMKVGDFQTEVKKVCGLTLLVATPDNFVTVLPEFTLDAVNILPNGLTKAKMQDILDR